jgi:hypothetical protein
VSDEKNDLAFKTKEIECPAALLPIEGTEGVVPLRSPQQVVATGDQPFHDFGRVCASAMLAVHIDAGDRGQDGGEALADTRVRVGGEEVGQLHQVAVRVENPARPRVAHALLAVEISRRSRRVASIREWRATER